ncbi:LPS translocon maturation chaperone LptM [Massilia sp. PWRC2]|uniref:LPS translocon maturation chaperone LptM n=1 Tax=Massilia sp. PWRC2 TaxID=2804626 RepID=UPI003CF673BA
MLALLLSGLSGCGQTGPLYLPKPAARPPVVQPATVAPVISTVPAQPNGSPSQ